MVNVAAFTPRVQLIPDAFAAHHQLTLGQSHSAEVELWSGPAAGEGEWLYADGAETRNHGTLVTAQPVSARIQRLLTEREATAGEQDVTTRRYLVALDHDTATLTTKARVKVLAGDPLLEGRYLSVLDVQGGSLRLERHLVCLDNMD